MIGSNMPQDALFGLAVVICVGGVITVDGVVLAI